MVLGEARDRGRVGEVGGAGQDERASHGLTGPGVDPGAEQLEAVLVGLALAGREEDVLGQRLGSQPRAVAGEVLRGSGRRRGHALAELDEPIGEVLDQAGRLVEDLEDGLEPAARLLAHRVLTAVRGVAMASEGHAVPVRELLPTGPEGFAVALVGLAVRGRVVDAVATALAGLEPDAPGATTGVLRVDHLEQGSGQLPEVVAVLGPGHAPAIGLEPVLRLAVAHGRVGEGVDAVVVPVEEVDQVVEAEAPGAVLHLVVRAGRVAALALHGEDPRGRARVLERHGLAESRRGAVARGPGVGLEEEGLALHLRVAGQVSVVAQVQEVLPHELALFGVRNRVARVPRAGVTDAQGFVVDGQQRVDRRVAVSGHQHEPVAAGQLGPAHVEAHPCPQGRGDEHRHLGARAAGVAALPQVEHQVDALVDQVPDHLPVAEVGGEVVEGRARRGRGAGHGGRRWAAPARIPTVSARGRARGPGTRGVGTGPAGRGLSTAGVTAPTTTPRGPEPAGCREGCRSRARGTPLGCHLAVTQPWPCGPCAWRPRPRCRRPWPGRQRPRRRGRR